MKVLICPDKFKGSISTFELCDHIGYAYNKQSQHVQVVSRPMADGGDGSIAVIDHYHKLTRVSVPSLDPLQRPLQGHYYIHGNKAYIEVASCSGIALLSPEEKDPLLTSTLGTGLLVSDALDKGAEEINIFLGGSATHDMGMGICHALGFRFYDNNDQMLEPCGRNLQHVANISSSTSYQNVAFRLLCDVTNPLLGPKGAAHTFAMQKGATIEIKHQLEAGSQHFSSLLQRYQPTILHTQAGMGAAGGIGACLTSLCGATIHRGFEVIATIARLEVAIQDVDIVISGEGCLDSQSLDGKLIAGVLSLCKKYNKRLYLILGTSLLTNEDMIHLGISGVYPISQYASSLQDSIDNPTLYISSAVMDLLRDMSVT